MAHYQYLIIGGGMTAAAALSGIYAVDEHGMAGLISMETDAPYDRPPLTKGLWKGKPVEKIWRKVDYPNVELHLGRRVVSINPETKQVFDDEGTIYTYDKLLLATGGKPRRLPFGNDEILYYRKLEDYRALRAMTETKRRFAVIGGGFIGSEIAAALAMNGMEVAMIFPDQGISGRAFPADLSQFINDYYRKKGVEVLSGRKITGFDVRGNQCVTIADDGTEVKSDAVIAGIGIQPNTSLAEVAGLKVDDGIVVDEFLRTSHADIYAAGDVANFYNPLLDRRLRVEHEDNANSMGIQAGKNMAAAMSTTVQPEPYNHLPYFYSDLFELGYEAVGDLDARLEIFADWQEPYQKGVVYYLDKGRVRGVLLWNVWSQVENARQLIGEPGPFTAKDLKGRLPKG